MTARLLLGIYTHVYMIYYLQLLFCLFDMKGDLKILITQCLYITHFLYKYNLLFPKATRIYRVNANMSRRRYLQPLNSSPFHFFISALERLISALSLAHSGFEDCASTSALKGDVRALAQMAIYPPLFGFEALRQASEALDCFFIRLTIHVL